MTAERRITAYCSRLVERGDTLIDNSGEHYLAAGPAMHARFHDGTQHVVPVLGGRTFSQLEWKPVDEFRYGKRIERSKMTAITTDEQGEPCPNCGLPIGDDPGPGDLPCDVCGQGMGMGWTPDRIERSN